jgi:hypothetical protein
VAHDVPVGARVRCLLALVLLASCFEHGSHPPDADDHFVCNPPGQICTSRPEPCGNNRIDDCWSPIMPGQHCTFTPSEEVCDGTALPLTCEQLGFSGGTIACSLTCATFDTSGCTACAPNTQCTQLAFNFVNDLAVSGTFVGVESANGVALFNGLTPIAQVTITNAKALVGTSQGFIVATSAPPTLSTLDTTGARGALHALPAQATAPVMAFAGGRVIIVWPQFANAAWHVFGAITDDSANILVPAFDLFTTAGSGVSVAAVSDGTSFFVAADGLLARVALDGTTSVTTGFPVQSGTEGVTDLAWDGTTGWYIHYDRAMPETHLIQRFDAAGARVGAVESVAGAAQLDYTSTGAELRVLRWAPVSSTPRGIFITRPTASGDVFERIVGASPQFGHAQVARLGTQTVVAWQTTEKLNLAIVP